MADSLYKPTIFSNRNPTTSCFYDKDLMGETLTQTNVHNHSNEKDYLNSWLVVYMGLNLNTTNFQMIYYSALANAYVFYRSATVPTIKFADGKYSMTPTSTAYWHAWNASTQTWGSQNTLSTSGNFPFDKTTLAEVDKLLFITEL